MLGAVARCLVFPTELEPVLGLQAFRAHLKRLLQNGVTWRSWKAWPCESRQDALETRKRIAAQYDRPNIDR
jgi:hypothetical protein